MKAFLFAALIAFAVPLAAHSKDYPLPDAEPMAAISLPDSWDVDDLDDGIEAVSKDELVYVAVETADAIDARAATTAAYSFFDDKGIVIDKASFRQSDIEVNGFSGFQLFFEGRDEDGPTRVSVTVLPVGETGAVMITYWASEDGEKSNPDGLMNIVNSVQARARTGQ